MLLASKRIASTRARISIGAVALPTSIVALPSPDTPSLSLAITRVVAKLNEGVSGDGNATIDVGSATAPMEIRARVDAMRFEASSMTLDRYLAKLAEHGGIVEELIAGRE